MSVTKELMDIAKSEIEKMGFEFVDLKYGKRGKKWYLQVFADKEGGINVGDCQEISRKLGYELDRHPDLIHNHYNLEVSSPGMDRQLKTEKDFNKYQNSDVAVTLYAPLENSRTWEGRILEAENGILVFEDRDGKIREMEIESIAKAKLIVKIL